MTTFEVLLWQPFDIQSYAVSVLNLMVLQHTIFNSDSSQQLQLW